MSRFRGFALQFSQVVLYVMLFHYSKVALSPCDISPAMHIRTTRE